ncbi:MAG: ATP-binding protein [Gammaproteobacteria bacterium]|nr:ATP-binding protein [Gammaproteobacteria bacterium]
MQTDRPSLSATDEQWGSLRALNLYRVFLAVLFISVAYFNTHEVLRLTQADFFIAIASIYLAASLIFVGLSYYTAKNFTTQVAGPVYIDIVVLTLLMHASVGVASGIGMLMIIVIAATGLLLGGRMAILFAAIASVSILGEHVYRILYVKEILGSSTQAGLLGISLFGTALLTRALSKRASQSAELASKRGIDLANLSELNEQIIQRMESGIVVLDDNNQVQHLNHAARNILNSELELPTPLPNLSAILYQAFQHWNKWDHTTIVPAISDIGDIQVRFRHLGKDAFSGTLIYLEDISAITDKLQQKKLAAIGRLTASIAHEIRNPLSAINHASQLLSESEKIEPEDKRLTEIIEQHTARVDHIIESITQLSRKDPLHSEDVILNRWLKHFIEEFQYGQAELNNGLNDVSVQFSSREIMIQFDANHLHQIMSNLCTNALTHGGGQIQITLDKDKNNTPYIDVRDNGKGIHSDIVKEIFEPFFTTSSQGTGLGLYITNQLCEVNNAQVTYESNKGNGMKEKGACFRVSFHHFKQS